MRLPGWNEQERTRLDRVVLRAVEEQPVSSRVEINLVASVWFLRVVPLRRVEFYSQRTVRENRYRQIAARRRSFG